MKYEEPTMEIIELESKDVIRTSGYHDSNNPGDDSSDAGGGWGN